MSEESSERRLVITILLVSTLLTMLGVAGVIVGASDLSLAPIPADAGEMYGEENELTAIQLEMIEVWVSNPYRRPMAAANVVVSALVLIGSFLLSWRRRLAQWWIKQAVVAKLLWIVAYTTLLAQHIQGSLPASLLDEAETTVSAIVTALILLGTLNGGLHIAAAYRATRPDVARFIEESNKADG
jgi:hypothetical protein